MIEVIKMKRAKRMRKFIAVMAAVMMFCNTFSQALPTMAMGVFCGIEDHTHTEECYASQTESEAALAS